MQCLIPAIIAGSILIIMTGNKSGDTAFKNMLSSEQQAVYSQIRQHRQNLALQGLALGVALAIAYKYFFKRQGGVCILGAIVLGTMWLYYQLMPKNMILNYLEGEDQIQAWTKLYSQYRYRGTVGMVLGVVVVLVASVYLNK